MHQPYLEVTFRRGLPLAAYYHLPRTPGQRSHRTRPLEHGLVVDLDENDQPIGIEITAPSALTLEAFNDALTKLGVETVGDAELSPLRAA